MHLGTPRIWTGLLVVGLCAAGIARGQDNVGAPAPPRPVLADGPPANRPPDDPGQPPGPGLFYVPGEFVPGDAGVTWRKGYWAKAQPGWTWLPARWERQSDGWFFEDGRWVRSQAALNEAWPPRQGQQGGGFADRVLEDRGVEPAREVVVEQPARTVEVISTQVVPVGLPTTYVYPGWGVSAYGPWAASYGFGPYTAYPFWGGGPGWIQGSGFGGVWAQQPYFVGGIGVGGVGFGFRSFGWGGFGGWGGWGRRGGWWW